VERRSGARPLREIVTPRPRILFDGINPSLRSARVGHHFAGPGNPFWRLLHAAGIVPEPLGFAGDVRLPEWGLALVNLCARATRTAAELRPAEIAHGRAALLQAVARMRPRVVALVGVTLYRRVFRAARTLSGGPGAKPERLAGARVYVVPNPSGLNAAVPGFRDKLVWYARLRRFADRVAGPPTRRRDRTTHGRTASRAASIAASIVASSWASETNHASNCDGGP
jgi:TDG/mug DNA glycosylase family protein